LQSDDSHLSLSSLNIRNVTPVHIQMHGQVGLCPPFLLSQRLDAFSELKQKSWKASTAMMARALDRLAPTA
jgi:hypothetical protein